jgi:hypothetical protein
MIWKSSEPSILLIFGPLFANINLICIFCKNQQNYKFQMKTPKICKTTHCYVATA